MLFCRVTLEDAFATPFYSRHGADCTSSTSAHLYGQRPGSPESLVWERIVLQPHVSLHTNWRRSSERGGRERPSGPVRLMCEGGYACMPCRVTAQAPHAASQAASQAPAHSVPRMCFFPRAQAANPSVLKRALVRQRPSCITRNCSGPCTASSPCALGLSTQHRMPSTDSDTEDACPPPGSAQDAPKARYAAEECKQLADAPVVTVPCLGARACAHSSNQPAPVQRWFHSSTTAWLQLYNSACGENASISGSAVRTTVGET